MCVVEQRKKKRVIRMRSMDTLFDGESVGFWTDLERPRSAAEVLLSAAAWSPSTVTST
jgi:hypothetical protein